MDRLKKFTAWLACAVLILTLAMPAAAADTTPTAVYSVNSAAYTYHTVPASDFAKIEKALALPSSKAALDQKAADLGGFCLFQGNGSKTLYIVTDTQILKDGKPLAATAAQRKTLLDLCRGYWNSPGTPELLGYMSPEKVTEIYCDGLGRNNVSFSLSLRRADAPSNVADFARYMKQIPVTDGTVIQRAPANTTADLMTVRLSFDTGVTYSIQLWDSSLTIHSSDASPANQTFRYDFTDAEGSAKYGELLRSDFQSRYRQFDLLDEAVIMDFSSSQPALFRLTQQDLPEKTALCQIGAFAGRFRQPPPIGIKSPMTTSGDGTASQTILDNAQKGSIILLLKPRGADTYEQIALYGDDRGGRWADQDSRGFWNPLLPGDCAFIRSLMWSGDPLDGAQAQSYLNLPLTA